MPCVRAQGTFCPVSLCDWVCPAPAVSKTEEDPTLLALLGFPRSSHLGFVWYRNTGDFKKYVTAGTWGIGRGRLPHTVLSYGKVIF